MLKVITRLVCDFCLDSAIEVQEEDGLGPGLWFPGQFVDKEAKEKGWRNIHNQDLCPKCAWIIERAQFFEVRIEGDDDESSSTQPAHG